MTCHNTQLNQDWHLAHHVNLQRDQPEGHPTLISNENHLGPGYVRFFLVGVGYGLVEIIP